MVMLSSPPSAGVVGTLGAADGLVDGHCEVVLTGFNVGLPVVGANEGLLVSGGNVGNSEGSDGRSVGFCVGAFGPTDGAAVEGD